MVDTVVRACLMEIDGVMDITDVHRLLACFYTDDGLLVARNPVLLHWTFNSLCAFFDCIGLNSNTTRAEAMVFLPGCIHTCLSADAYKARMSDPYQEERRGRKVTYQGCGLELAVGSLWSHLEK